MLLFDADPLPAFPSPAETALADRLGPEGIREIDEAILHASAARFLKVARIVIDSLDAVGSSWRDEPTVHLHVRRVIALAKAGRLESQGDLHRPRWSEVRRVAVVDGS